MWLRGRVVSAPNHDNLTGLPRDQEELRRQLAIIEQFKSRKVYEQVLSRKLRVERMRCETPDAPPTVPKAFRLSFRTGTAGTGGVRLEGVSKSHGGRLLLSDVDLEIGRGTSSASSGPTAQGRRPSWRSSSDARTPMLARSSAART